MPNIRVEEETLKALRRVRAMLCLQDDDKEHSLDEALQMVLSYYLDAFSLKTPDEVRVYAELLEGAKKELEKVKMRKKKH